MGWATQMFLAKVGSGNVTGEQIGWQTLSARFAVVGRKGRPMWLAANETIKNG